MKKQFYLKIFVAICLLLGGTTIGYAQLAGGTYTINSAVATGGGNYISFTAAISAMSAGVSGPVTFNVVAGSGPYNESITIASITGASATNRIRFNGNGATVQKSLTTTYTGMLMMNGAKYVTFDSINFVTQNATYGSGAILYNACTYDTITRCTFNMASVTSTSSTNYGLRISTTASGASTTASGGTNCYIANNKFLATTGSGGLYYMMYTYGPNTNNIYANNVFSNPYYYGLYSYYEAGVKYLNNTFTRETKTDGSVGYYAGVTAYYSGAGTQFVGNIVKNLGGATDNGSYCYPFSIYYASGTAASPILVANNLITNMTSDALYGLRTYSCTYINVVHNTVNCDIANSYTGAQYFFYNYICNNLNFQNNIVSCTQGGGSTKYGFYHYNNTNYTSDKNDVYINSAQAGTQYYAYYYNGSTATLYTTLAAFQAAGTGLDANGKSVDPLFYSVATGNLVPTEPTLRTLGADFTASVPKDILGFPRSTTPTIGAFEYALPNDIATDAVVSPSGNVCTGAQNVVVRLKNPGNNNITSATVNWSFNSTLRTPVTYSRTLGTALTGNNTDTISLGSATLLAGVNTIKVWTSAPNGVSDVDKTNDTLVYTITPATFTVSATYDTVCPASNSVLTLSPSATYATGALQWQSSPNGTTWTNIAGTDNVNYTVAGITANTYYRAQILTGGTGCYSPSKTIVYSNPIVTTVTPATRCGTGVVTLAATTAATNSLAWYKTPTGGTILGTGGSYVTPYLTRKDTFYVAAVKGCESLRTPVIATLTTAPTATASIVSPTSGILCKGNTASLKATSTNANYAYSWSSGQSGSAITVSPAVTTKYIVYANDATTNCGSIDSVTMTVLDQPAIVSPAATQTICQGTTKVFSANTGTGLTYQWIRNNAVITGATSATYSATTAGDYSVLVTHTPSGCFNEAMPVTLNVTPLPNVAVTPTGNTTLCNGSVLTITAPGSNNYTYEWYQGTSTTVLGTSSTFTTTTAGTYKVKITGSGCTNTSATTVVTILPLPTALMTPDSTETNCDTIKISSPSTGVSYQWYYNGNSILGATDSTYNVTASGNYNVVVTSKTNGCSAETPSVQFNINPSPLAAITYASPLTFCDGSSVTLNSIYYSNYAYNWTQDGSPYGSGLSNIQASTSGLYGLDVVDMTTGCHKMADPEVKVEVKPLPTPTITYDNASNKLSTTQPFATYQWYKNSVSIGASGTQAVYTPTASGAYNVSVTNTDGCTGTSEMIFINQLGVSSTFANTDLKLFPNPTNGLVQIATKEKVSYTVQDMTGKVITRGDNATIDLTTYADGVYFILISDKEGKMIFAERILKSNK